jgi:arsenite methyltransferase
MRVVADPASIKACCAAAYGSDAVELLLGPSYHPGGLTLTQHLLDTVAVTDEDLVLDVAAGRGATAMLAAESFGARVTGIDLSSENMAIATERVADGQLAGIDFQVGDAESLPVGDSTQDVVVSECAFCTFPNKSAAAAEFARVLRPGGRLGITDMTAFPENLPSELTGLLAWVSCIADARPASEYAEILERAGLRITTIEDHAAAVSRMIDQIEARLKLVRITMPERWDGFGWDTAEVKSVLGAARQAVREDALGYALLTAVKPGP